MWICLIGLNIEQAQKRDSIRVIERRYLLVYSVTTYAKVQHHELKSVVYGKPLKGMV